MTQIATVEARIGEALVRIAVRRETACGHDCENCGGCGVSGGQVLRVEARDPIGCAVGDKVLVESDTGQILSAAALVYLLPLVTLISGYAVGAAIGPLFWQILLTPIGFLLGLLPALRMDRKAKQERQTAFRIVEKLSCTDT